MDKLLDLNEGDNLGEGPYRFHEDGIPRYELADREEGALFDGVRGSLFVPYPLDCPNWWGYESALYDERIYRKAGGKGSFTNGLNKLKKRREREAQVHEEPDVLKFDFEVKKTKPTFTPQELPKQIHYLSDEYPEWSLYGYMPAAYGLHLYPYLKGKEFSDPFDWAYAHTELATGMVGRRGEIRKFPLGAIEYPFVQLAASMTNLCPPWHAETKRIVRTPELEELRARAVNTIKPLRPEVQWLILNNPEVFADLAVYEKHLSTLHRCIDQGLLIERADAFLKTAPNTHTALELMGDVYGGDLPWWFKEDIDFAGLCAGADAEGFEYYQKIGKRCKAGFVYGVQIFKEAGPDFFAEADVPEQELWEVFAYIVNHYGIGNPKRGVWILNWMVEGMKTLRSANEKQEFLRLALKQAAYERPSSPILGRMQGVDTGISFSGLTQFFMTMRGEQTLKEDKIDDTNLGVGHLMLMDQMVRRPLVTRALEQGKPRVSRARYRLLPAPDRTHVPQLTTTHEQTDTAALLGLLTFYERLNGAELEHYEDVATYYWMFFAAKLPDPYRPPLRLLQFIDRVVTQRVTGHRDVFFEAPWEREKVHQRNAALKVSQFETAASMLTGLSFGLVTEDETLRLLENLLEGGDLSKGGDTDIEKVREEASRRYAAGQFLGLNMEMAARGWLPKVCLDALIEDWKRHDTRIRASVGGKPRVQNAEWMRRMFEEAGLNPKELQELVDTGGYSDLAMRTRQLRKGERPYGPLDLVEDLWGAAEALSHLPPVVTEVDEAVRSEYHRTIDRMAWAGTTETVQTLDLVARDTARKFNDWVESYWVQKPYAIKSLVTPERIAQQVPALRVMHQFYEDYLGVSHELTPRDLHALVDAVPNPQGEMSQAAFDQVDSSLAGLLLAVELERENLSLVETGDLDPVARLTQQTAGITAFVLALGSDAELLNPRQIAEKPSLRNMSQLIYEVGQTVKRALAGSGEHRAASMEVIHQFRREDFGLIPVGAKIHVLSSINEKQVEMLRNILGLGHTAFKLIHAGTSLLLPGVPSGRELALLLQSLERLGIFDSSSSELQICLPGRLGPHDVAILGSTVLSASRVVIDYTLESFKTSHDEATGARMMAYDAGGPRDDFLPFMPKLEGRTDMLGRRHPEDILMIQRVGTILAHDTQKPQGRFAHHAAWFRSEHERILERYGIAWILRSPWIFQSEEEKHSDDGAIEHYRAVQACSDAHDRGLNVDMRNLLSELEAKMVVEQKQLLNGDKACKERDQLLH